MVEEAATQREDVQSMLSVGIEVKLLAMGTEKKACA